MDTNGLGRLNGIKLAVVLEVLPNDPFPMCPRNVFDGYLVLDPTMRHEDKNVFAFPRPLEMLDPLVAHVDSPIPVIGTFGFATRGKGFERVVLAVNNEFDRAIIRINIPHGTYVPRSKAYAKEIAEACIARAKKGIEIRVTHDYMTKQQLVDWCAENTLNCFLYDRNIPGLAATTDQAILSMRPLAVSQNDTFRHVIQYVRPYPEWSLRDSIAKSGEGVAKMKAAWCPSKFAERFGQVLSTYHLFETVQTEQKQFMLPKRARIPQMIDEAVGLRMAIKKKCSDYLINCYRSAVLIWFRCRRTVVRKYRSYSQAGEDLIVSALFRSFGMSRFSYLDVGANHPDFISNTYLFYKQGSRGVCVEPNSALCTKHRRLRPEDVCLNVGVGFDDRKTADFYLFGGFADGLSTFSKSDAEHWVNVGMDGIGKFRSPQVVIMPLMSINEIISKTGTPDFLSVDVEGLDLEILRTLDFERYPIKCICVETLRHDQNQQASRDIESLRFMEKHGYIIYADTGINTIFVNLNWLSACHNNLGTAGERAT
jgi:FkbM family methyltransferase